MGQSNTKQSTVEPTGEMVATLRQVLELCGYGVGAGAARAALTAALLVQVEQREGRESPVSLSDA